MNIFFGVMTAVPVALKLAGVVDWPWHFILAPIVGPLAILGFMYLLAKIFVKKKTSKPIARKALPYKLTQG